MTAQVLFEAANNTFTDVRTDDLQQLKERKDLTRLSIGSPFAVTVRTKSLEEVAVLRGRQSAFFMQKRERDLEDFVAVFAVTRHEREESEHLFGNLLLTAEHTVIEHRNDGFIFLLLRLFVSSSQSSVM